MRWLGVAAWAGSAAMCLFIALATDGIAMTFVGVAGMAVCGSVASYMSAMRMEG